MITYNGFTVDQMLHYLSKYCEQVSINSCRKGWVLVVVSKQGLRSSGRAGSLFRVVKEAFEPYKAMAMEDRVEKQKLIKSIVRST